jgi:hypothetical protein
MREDFQYLKLLSYNIYILADRSTTDRPARLNLIRGWLNTSHILDTIHLGNL